MVTENRLVPTTSAAASTTASDAIRRTSRPTAAIVEARSGSHHVSVHNPAAHATAPVVAAAISTGALRRANVVRSRSGQRHTTHRANVATPAATHAAIHG